jgi:hypothetical protein
MMSDQTVYEDRGFTQIAYVEGLKELRGEP